MNTGQLLGYSRVSVSEQDLNAQRVALRKLGCQKVFAENISDSGGNQPPHLAALMDYVKKGDKVHVTNLDRLARDAEDALKIAGKLREKGVGLVIHDIGGIDINSEVGRLVYTVLSAVAKMERTRIRTRQQNGIQAAKAAGKHLGRKPALTEEQRLEVRELVELGVPKRQVAERMGVSRNTVYKALA